MNAYEHYLVDVSGTRVHFMRKPGVGPDPVPLILSHGWPWTFWHWSKVMDRLVRYLPDAQYNALRKRGMHPGSQSPGSREVWYSGLASHPGRIASMLLS
jgi:pimeloyl-ACP methyl ester carboxylesterase